MISNSNFFYKKNKLWELVPHNKYWGIHFPYYLNPHNYTYSYRWLLKRLCENVHWFKNNDTTRYFYIKNKLWELVSHNKF